MSHACSNSWSRSHIWFPVCSCRNRGLGDHLFVMAVRRGRWWPVSKCQRQNDSWWPEWPSHARIADQNPLVSQLRMLCSTWWPDPVSAPQFVGYCITTIESSVTSMFTTTTGLPSLIVIIGVEEPFSDFGDSVSVFVSSSKFALYVLLNSSESA